MLATFLSITPIFIVMAVGIGLRKTGIFDEGFWTGLDRLGFYVLYPVLLFSTILQADFSTLALGTVFTSALGGMMIVGLLLFALWPILKSRNVSGPTFSSLFQGSLRWNAFIALAVAEKMFPPEGVAMVGLLMAAIVIPLNVASISVVVGFAEGEKKAGNVGLKILLNPLVVAVAAALVMRALPFSLPSVIDEAIHLLARAALGMGLLAIGAGLRLDELVKPRPVIFIPVALKLFAFPIIVLGLAVLMGLPSEQLPWLALCACVPTAMNGYVVARQMGGDAPAYAITVTIQTAIAFLSIPLFQQVAALLAG